MKVREDFVTNSSSSSFILAFESKEDGIAKIAAMTKRYGSDYVGQLLHDFMEATPILKENIRTHTFRDVEDDAEFVTDNGEGGWWSSDKPTFERQWMNEHPGSDYRAYYESKERKAEVERRMEEYFKKIEIVLKSRTRNERWTKNMSYNIDCKPKENTKSNYQSANRNNYTDLFDLFFGQGRGNPFV